MWWSVLWSFKVILNWIWFYPLPVGKYLNSIIMFGQVCWLSSLDYELPHSHPHNLPIFYATQIPFLWVCTLLCGWGTRYSWAIICIKVFLDRHSYIYSLFRFLYWRLLNLLLVIVTPKLISPLALVVVLV